MRRAAGKEACCHAMVTWFQVAKGSRSLAAGWNVQAPGEGCWWRCRGGGSIARGSLYSSPKGPVCVAKGCWSQKRTLVDFAIDAEDDSGLQAHHHPGRYTDLWTQWALESTPELAAEQWVMSWVYCRGLLLDVLTDVVSRGQCFYVSFDSSEVLQADVGSKDDTHLQCLYEV